ncbi:hypothetical protein LGAA44_450015 [Leuconostoc gasicomitatum]|nr:hypothetical protein LGAA44_450015 [Leuconostoc gasicomitatum]
MHSKINSHIFDKNSPINASIAKLSVGHDLHFIEYIFDLT